MRNSPELILKDIKDDVIRENFDRIVQYFEKDSWNKLGLKFFEITFGDGGTDLRYKHGLGFIPKDVIVTSTSDNENVIFNYADFTTEYFYFDVSGACTVRFFAGTYRE